MCRVSRRDVLLGGAALLSAAAAEVKAAGKVKKSAPTPPPPREIGKVETLAPDVYFHEGNIAVGHCNNGWIVFDDFVLVIDANYPSGAREIIPKIKAVTDKPIRFAFDTHHHGDHAYGNQVWVEQGATPLAHTGVLEEMKRVETKHYGGGDGRWEQSARGRKDVAESKFKPPSLLFPKDLVFDDGKRRVELMHLGVAHTIGDAFAWLPKERILFTGDACVNGPFNFTGDGNIEKWMVTLEAAKRLGAKTICPGHGQFGVESVLADQQLFFKSLWEGVGRLVREKKTPQQIKDAVPALAAQLKANAQIARYVGERQLAAQVEKALSEMTGEKFPAARTASAAKHWHSHQHGLPLIA